MSEEEEQGFVVRDKRGQSREESPAPQDAPTPSPASEVLQEAPMASDHIHDQAPPLNFSSFIFSLSSSALMLMGEKLSPDQPSTPVNLPQAKEIVDILSILDEKTKGNLTPEEAAVMKDMLYTLRMKFVQAATGKSLAS
ncbi:MAG: DUF1844 domain-containing protein [Nitrospirae bacterium]|nr:DUF1844 domain-containing protein [Nitrospirota bacterium]MDA1305369.1 DUF1844 domain-containing protein [Nitrospirota bacterium]